MKTHAKSVQGLDSAPPLAGLPYEPGSGDLIMLASREIPPELAGHLGIAALRKSMVLEHTISDVWPTKRSG